MTFCLTTAAGIDRQLRRGSGTAVTVSYGGANIDPAAFPDGDQVRFDRTDNRHIAFGAGVHRCLGSHLARRELRVAIAEWSEYSISRCQAAVELTRRAR